MGFWAITIGGSAFATTADSVNPEGRSGGPVIAEYAAYGATQPVFVNLGNSKVATKFTMTRTHASDTAAYNYYMSAIETWAGVATVVVSHTDYSGTVTTWTLTNAKVELEVPTIIGLTTITKLTFTSS